MKSESMGLIDVDGPHTKARFVRWLSAPVDEVWAALTEPELLGRWLASGTFETREGGTVDLRFDDGSTMHGRITAIDAPRLIAHEWHFASERPSHVTFRLEPTEGGTVLRLDHEVAHDDATDYGAGWHTHLELLERVVSGSLGQATGTATPTGSTATRTSNPSTTHYFADQAFEPAPS